MYDKMGMHAMFALLHTFPRGTEDLAKTMRGIVAAVERLPRKTYLIDLSALNES